MLARLTLALAVALSAVGCGSDTAGADPAKDGGGLDANCGDACLDAAPPPCAECDTKEWGCVKPPFDNPNEIAGFPITEITATSCGGIKRFGVERLTVHCDTQELCSDIACEKYKFSGKTLSTPSGISCVLY